MDRSGVHRVGKIPGFEILMKVTQKVHFFCLFIGLQYVFPEKYQFRRLQCISVTIGYISYMRLWFRCLELLCKYGQKKEGAFTEL